MNTLTMNITPEMAQQWLTNNNQGNRILKPKVVQNYVSEMLAGSWVLTHQGIAFDTNNRLIDGQHRLNAIVVSGITVPMRVTFGIDPSDPDHIHYGIDMGKARTMGDTLNLPDSYFSIYRTLWELLRTWQTGSKPTKNNILPLDDIFSGFISRLTSTSAVGRSLAPIKAAVVMRMAQGYDIEQAYWDFANNNYEDLVKHQEGKGFCLLAKYMDSRKIQSFSKRFVELLPIAYYFLSTAKKINSRSESWNDRTAKARCALIEIININTTNKKVVQ